MISVILKKMRIRKKFSLILCGVTLSVFLILYILLNNAVPHEKPDQDISYIEKKLKLLENGFNRHREEVGEIKKKITLIETKNDKENDILNKKDMFQESVIKVQNLPNSRNDNNRKCSLQPDVVPTVTNQMLNLYDQIPFDNVDGGVWKQGWNIKYDEHEWNNHHKLKVFVVPHSHNDPGWIKTFDDYYEHETKPIFANMVRHLHENEKMKFIWCEISYFARWYDVLGKETQDIVRSLIKRKQLEFVTGGWVMPDEANSHWYSILQQLTEGQTWLHNTFNVTPRSSWAIDPFGHTPTMPYILKNSGFENLLIQRTHYSVKKRLAKEKELEFMWRQTWDTTDQNDLFTHMMPFYSYDVPHTCGPDPKVCCQFDFKRLPGYGVSCPWKIAPQQITESNVRKKSELILDQWRKKSTLYKTRSVLIPLGDDFRYTQSTEWEHQRMNYEKIFEFVNNEPELNVEAKFATLQEYFDSIHKEHKLSEFPTLSGDFFTYADRDDHYWSGYYTSRPYHKRVDRILMNYLRSAEMLHAWSHWSADSGLDKKLSDARRALSLFQHHDGITGTAKDHVVLDYARKMNDAIADCKFVMQQAVYRLLTLPTIYQPDYRFVYFNIDDSRTAGPNDNRPTIILGEEIPDKYVVIHNSLPYERSEVVEFYIGKPYVTIVDFYKSTVPCQVAPVWSWHKHLHGNQPQFSTTKYRLFFKATVPPMGLAVYTITSKNSEEDSIGATMTVSTILSNNPNELNLNDYPLKIEFSTPHDISINNMDGSSASFNQYGLLKSVATDSDSGNFPIHLSFLKYGVTQNAQRSGAYLFLPDGPAETLGIGNPTVLLSKGPFESSVSTSLPFALHENILREGSSGIEIRNLVDIGDMKNTEIIMRLSTNIQNKEEFYTDLNGVQIIKRKRFSKLPLQANYYPVPSTMFIQDDFNRLTLFSAQPLGGSSLNSGEMEIMQDRRLMQDDERGLGQGVMDNKPVQHIFKLMLESRDSCKKLKSNYPAGFLTLKSYNQIQALLHPLEKFIFTENDWTGVASSFGSTHESLEPGMEVVLVRDLPHIVSNPKSKLSSIGLVVHRTNVDECTTDVNREGNVNIKKMIGIDDERKIYSSLITLLKRDDLIEADEINLCPMDIKAFVVNR